MADLVIPSIGTFVDPTADSLDLLTLAEAKLALNIDADDTDHDGEVARFNTAASRRIDELCGPVVIRTVTDEFHHGGKPYVILEQAPASETSATTITTVNEYSAGTAQALTAETVTTSTAYNFFFDRKTGILSRRTSWSDMNFATHGVVVTYEAGRYEDTASVDRKFKQAAGILLAHLWRPTQGISGTFAEAPVPLSGFAVPNAVIELLGDEIQPPNVA